MAAAASSPAEKIRSANFETDLSCPVQLIPLFEAVSLFPCAHKVNATIARELFGETMENFCIRTQKPCPVCQGIVIGYSSDHTVRDLAHLYFDPPRTPALPERSLAVPPVAPPSEPPYPGRPGIFFHQEGDWQPHNFGGNLVRVLKFSSKTPDSLIEEIHLSGYKNGRVDLLITIRREKRPVSEDILSYFRFYKLDDDNTFLGILQITTPRGIKTLFAILAKNNKIPEPFLQQMRAIIDGLPE